MLKAIKEPYTSSSPLSNSSDSEPKESQSGSQPKAKQRKTM